ncbi:MAG: hypothetical protein WCJ19_02850 [bacterium]
MQKIYKTKRVLVLLLVFISAFIFVTPVVNAQVNGADYAVVVDASLSTDDPSGIQKVKLEIKSGINTNSIFETSFKQPTANIKRDLQKGDIVLVRFNLNPIDNKIQSVQIQEFYRVPNVFWAPLFFIMLLLIIAVVKYRRKVLMFLGISSAVAISSLLIVFLKFNAPFAIIASFSIMYFILLYVLYKKISISFVGFLLPIVLGISAMLFTFITLQLAQLQLTYLAVTTSFYSIQNNDYYEAFYSAVLFASLIGAVYIAYQQILDSIKIKITNTGVTKRELTLRSFKNMIKNFDSIIFPCLGFLVGIMFSLFLFLQRSVGLEAALNNDYWVSISILSFISLIVWIATVPLCALLCGMILGRLEQHKVVTDKTISILD